ncbi:MAG: hypothetical protein KF795_00390 [Labilithrix sp.]|nr:hypothetical protein [Labilithrix sp.]
MSAPQHEEDDVRAVVPVADLSIIDATLDGALEHLKEAVQKIRPADIGRDLSRRSIEVGCRLVQASDDRRAAAMLRAAHPAVAANLLAASDSGRAARILDFMPMDHQVAILGAMRAPDRARVESAMAPDDRARVERALSQSEAAVSRLMTPKVCDVAPSQTRQVRYS